MENQISVETLSDLQQLRLERIVSSIIENPDNLQEGARELLNYWDQQTILLMRETEYDIMDLVFMKFLIEFERQSDRELIGKEGGKAMGQVMSRYKKQAINQTREAMENKGNAATVSFCSEVVAAAVESAGGGSGGPVQGNRHVVASNFVSLALTSILSVMDSISDLQLQKNNDNADDQEDG